MGNLIFHCKLLQCIDIISRYKEDQLRRAITDESSKPASRKQLSPDKSCLPTYELVASLIEQGLIVQLDLISRGIRLSGTDIDVTNELCGIHKTSTDGQDSVVLFPETCVRHVAAKYLAVIAEYVIVLRLTRLRIIDSFSYSSGHNLPVNVLTGIIYLCRCHNTSIGEMIWRDALIRAPRTAPRSDSLSMVHMARESNHSIRLSLRGLLSKDAHLAKQFMSIICILTRQQMSGLVRHIKSRYTCIVHHTLFRWETFLNLWV